MIEEDKDLYYKALGRTQRSLTTETPDWEPWIRFFLHCLKKQKEHLAAKINNLEIDHDTTLPITSFRIVEMLRIHPRLSISELAQLLITNRNTLKVHLRDLVLTGNIRSHGKGRGVWYSLT